VWEWLFKIVTSFVESLKNAHQGTPPTDPPGGPSATK